MRAIQLQAPGRFAVIDADEPRDPGPGEAQVRVHRVGVCGTDVGGYLGKMPFFTYPRVPGHELGVEVVAVGEGVTNVQVGDRCAVEPYMNCGDCYACKKGATNCCRNLKVLGVMTDGGLTDRVTLPARKLHPAASLGYEQLALVETLAIGRHAVSRSGLTAGETCAIVGAGPIGLAALEFVRLTGARFAVIDANPSRLAFCREKQGVEHALVAGEIVADELREALGDLPDVVIDATGSAAAMAASLGLIAPTGRVVFVGITASEVTFAHPPLHRVEGTILCSRNALPDDFARIIESIEAGKIDTALWISHRTTFDAVIGEFPAYTRAETGVIKAIIDVTSGVNR